MNGDGVEVDVATPLPPGMRLFLNNTGESQTRRRWPVTAFYSCDPGYHLNGSAVRNCHHETGEWDGIPPACIPIQCDVNGPEVTFGAELVGMTIGGVFPSVATLRCKVCLAL